jgi:PPM family protein phosphatase
MNKDTEDPEAAARRRAMSPVLEKERFQPLSASVRVSFGVRSETGPVRAHNEDHYVVFRLGRSQETLATSLSEAESPGRFDEAAYVMVVADGMGDTGAGAAAGRVALTTLIHLVLHFGRWNVRVDGRTAFEIFERLEWCYGRLGEVVARAGDAVPELAGMATTLTAAYSAGDELFIAHVGHSRAYLYRDGELRQLTRDQTMAQRLEEQPRPAPVASQTSDLRHLLTDVIGGRGGTTHVQLARLQLRDGDSVLLCTDGLNSVVSNEQIANLLAGRRSAPDLTRALVDRALVQGGQDNVTVVLAQYQIPPGQESSPDAPATQPI